MRRLKHTIPKNILKVLYLSLINPHLNYGILAWGYNIDRITKLQKKAIRIITHSYILAHTSNLFMQLKILKIEDIFSLKQIIFYYKFITNSLPISLKNILTKQDGDLRLCHTSYFLKPPIMANLECTKKSIKYSIPALINNFTTATDENENDRSFIENISSLTLLSLKTKFKIITFEKYAFSCTDQNCYPCISRFFNSFGFARSLKYLHMPYYMINFKYQKIFLSTGILEFLNIFNYINIPR